MKLRDYQVQAIEDLRAGLQQGHKRQILTLPTGAGKTVVAAAIAVEAANKGKVVLSITDRLTLHTQAGNHFEVVGLNVGTFQAQNTNISDANQLINATAQTIAARIKRADVYKQDIRDFDIGLILIDEAHVIYESHRQVLEYFSDVPVIGLSATPSHESLAQLYSNLVRGPTIAEMIEMGSLVPFRIFAPTSQIDLTGVALQGGEFKASDVHEQAVVITADIVLNWAKNGEGRPTIAFCANINHADELAQEFRQSGIKAAAIHSRIDAEDRRELYRMFRDREIDVLTSVDVLSVGFDEPIASCAILARPTASTTIHVQQCGRVIRLSEGKVDALIFDHAGNCERHGQPQDYMPPELEDSEPKAKTKRVLKEKEKKTFTCSKCQAVMKATDYICPACGAERFMRSDVVVEDGVLEESTVSKTVTSPADLTPEQRTQLFRELLGNADEKGWKRGSAVYQYEQIRGDLPWNEGVNLKIKNAKSSPPGAYTKRLLAKNNRQQHAIKNAVRNEAQY